MSFRAVNEKYLLPASQILMVLGIMALCQPWSLGLHSYGVTIILIGLIGFNITSKIAPEQGEESPALRLPAPWLPAGTLTAGTAPPRAATRSSVLASCAVSAKLSGGSHPPTKPAARARPELAAERRRLTC